MALVRCTCLVQVSSSRSRGPELVLQVPDPTCGYVLHRLAAELAGGPDPALA
jgi:hypothetical protein